MVCVLQVVEATMGAINTTTDSLRVVESVAEEPVIRYEILVVGGA